MFKLQVQTDLRTLRICLHEWPKSYFKLSFFVRDMNTIKENSRWSELDTWRRTRSSQIKDLLTKKCWMIIFFSLSPSILYEGLFACVSPVFPPYLWAVTAAGGLLPIIKIFMFVKPYKISFSHWLPFIELGWHELYDQNKSKHLNKTWNIAPFSSKHFLLFTLSFFTFDHSWKNG